MTKQIQKNQAKKTDSATTDSSSAEDEDVDTTDEMTEEEGAGTQEPANDEPGETAPKKRPSANDLSNADLLSQAQQLGIIKAVSFNEIVDAVRSTLSTIFQRINDLRYDGLYTWFSDLLVYTDTAVLCMNMQYWRFSYSLEDGRAIIPPMSDWERVEHEWVASNAGKAVDLLTNDTVVTFGTEVKALGDHRIGGYLVRFTDPDTPDLTGDYFDAKSDFGFHNETDMYWDHGQDRTLGRTSILKPGTKATLTKDEVGVWIEGQLDDSNRYLMAVEKLLIAGKMAVGFSSGTAPHLVVRVPVPGKKNVNYIAKWPLGLDASPTVKPAAGPELTRVTPLKQLSKTTAVPSLKSILETADQLPLSNEVDEMSLTIEEITAAMKGVVGEALKPIEAKLETHEKTLGEMKAAPATNKLPVGGDAPPADAPQEDATKSVLASLYINKFGDPSDAMKQVFMEAAGKSSQNQLGEFLVDQTAAFGKYIRLGEARLTPTEQKLIETQVFPMSVIKSLVESGYDMAAIKETQLISQGRLGGYAVPPNMQEGIISRLPGMTVVRSNGATIFTLANGAMGVDIILDNGGGSQYPSGFRGQWGGESSTAVATNTTFNNIMTMVNPYQFKVTVTTMMLQSVSSIVSYLEKQITETAAQDEDLAFLMGTGTGGQPLGIIPDGVNTLGITEVTSATATAGTIDPDKIIELLDAVDDQYADGTIMAMSKATRTQISLLKDQEDRYLVSDGLGTGPRQTNIRGVPIKRTQHMSDIAANAFPIIHGNMAGYAIVELPGLTIRRMQDSGTGLGKVEFHVQRFLTGRVYEKYRFALMKTTAA